MIHCRSPWGRTMPPIPDGSLSQADRQFIPGRYSGILWVAPSDLTACYVFISSINENFVFVSDVSENYVFKSDIKAKAG